MSSEHGTVRVRRLLSTLRRAYLAAVSEVRREYTPPPVVPLRTAEEVGFPVDERPGTRSTGDLGGCGHVFPYWSVIPPTHCLICGTPFHQEATYKYTINMSTTSVSGDDVIRALKRQPRDPGAAA